MLSTKLGYGLPAFFARALAADFCAGVNGTDFLFGFGLFQTFFAAMLQTVSDVYTISWE